MNVLKKLICAILSVCVLLSGFGTFAAEKIAPITEIKSLDDYPDEAILMDANEKDSIKAAGLEPYQKNTNENKYSAVWSLSKTSGIAFSAVQDISAYGTLRFSLFGDEDHPTRVKLVIDADNPDTEKWDYYDGGFFDVKPGWNEYSFNLANIKNKKVNEPKPFDDISSICLRTSGWSMQNDLNNTVLYLDTVKLIKGEKILIDIVYPEEEAGTTKYFDFDFEVNRTSDLVGATAVEKSNKMELAQEGENKYLSIESTGTAEDCHFDAEIKHPSRYMVISADFKHEVPVFSYVILLKDKANNQERIITLKDDGGFYCGSKVAQTKAGEWVNIAVCMDVLNRKYNVYVDGKLILENVNFANGDFAVDSPLKVARVYVGRNDVGAKIGVDNFKMFDGKTPGDYEKATDAPSAVQNTEVKQIDVNSSEIPAFVQAKADSVAEVKDAVCLKVNSPFALVRHEQKAIDENNKEVAPFVVNGRTLVPVRFIAEAFGAEVSWDGDARKVTVKKGSDLLNLKIGSNILNKNGTDITIDVPAEIYNERTMLPLRAVTENLGKKVFWDDMGLIIISDNEINFTRENDLDKMLDIMAGFTYERPSREQIKEDILKTAPNHPRIYATSKDFDRLREYVKTDENLKEWFKALILQADDFVKKAEKEAPPVYIPSSDGRAGDHDMPEKGPVLGMAYQLTGDKKYVDAAWHTIGEMCNWEHWHPGHFLNCAEMMLGVAIAYDWMYDAWTPEQRTKIEDALYDCGVEDSITAYYGANDYLAPPKTEWHRSGWWGQGNNWNAVCNAGMMGASLALATHEKYGDIAVKGVYFALNGIEVGLRCYAPDGGYEEGPGYWVYGTNHAVSLVAAIESATGSDYGLADAPGFNIAYSTPVYSESMQGMFNYSDSTPTRIYDSTFFWFGRKFNNSAINGIRYNEIKTGQKSADWRDILWYDPENIDKEVSLLMDYSFFDTQTLTMRSSWTDVNQIFTGIHGGSNNTNHCHIDSGTFILDALNTRWFIDLGSENYNLPGGGGRGPGGGRWWYYANRAEGHNVYVINPGLLEEQQVYSFAKIIKQESKPRGAYGIMDLSQAYQTDAKSATRGLMLGANRKAVILQDEIEMKEPSEFYWFAHTKAQVEIAADGRSAVLTQNGKKLHCQIVSDNQDLKFGVMDANPLPTSPKPPVDPNQRENPRDGIRKLVIHSNGIENVNMAVVFQPLDNSGVPEYSYTYTKLDNWSVPDGEVIKPEIESITIDGVMVDGFDKSITDYSIKLPYGTTRVPEIAATADADSICQISLPEASPGVAVIKAVNKEDPSMYTVYNVVINVKAETEIIASGFQEGNPPEHCMDKLLGTRWAVDGEAWGIFEFANPKKVSSVWLAAWKANQRKLIFDIEVSADGENFTQVWSGQTTYDKEELEEFKIPEGEYKAIKLVFHGTTTEVTWNSVLEVEFR